ncbi:uncharacterized protein N7515_000453 [Penicillium bovifimosum]|uniref:G domain-containing protein n=1 Tax=Penicillium bovifimosum TaxID=126998 RepID=A0A9W9HF46_9EURO|nr:uncharacterized protein N7515_000453 [Penicillium bovifimosum]KAJ5145889.1 hypothetical protein N7515_000453 [Penicillium bovifimosum]
MIDAINQTQRVAAFTGITKPDTRDKFFLVMGMTGSGKSTFVGRCTGEDVTVGHGLNSCTSAIDVFDFDCNGHRVYLIDTPGFNDTNRSDIETLGVLATYLGASYANGVRIHGILMLHPISDNRMSGSTMRNLEMMKAMCGFSSYANLAIATTMWSTNSSLCAKREEQLLDGRFFGDLIAKGAKLFRHNEKGRLDSLEEVTSARRIVTHLIRQSDNHTTEVLRLQREIIDQQKMIGETQAGIVLAGDLYKVRQEHERELQKLRAKVDAENHQRNAEHVAELQELQADLEKQLKKAEKDRRALRKSMQDLHEEEERAWRKRLKEMEKKFLYDLAVREEELLEMEESLAAVIRDAARRGKTSQQITSQLGRYEEEVDTVRTEVSQARHTYQKLSGQTHNLFNGASNGIASGMASGVITAAIAGGLFCTVM